jgi:hypothetical protein
MRKIDERHPACLLRHWEVWKYHRSIDKWKGYKLRKRYETTKRYKATKTARSYAKSTKLRKRYENDTQLRKRYDVTKKLRSYQHGTKLRKRYEDVTKYVTKDLGYEVTKLRDSSSTNRDNLLWRIVMHYGEMPRAKLGSSDLRSQVAIFGEWNIYVLEKKYFVKFQTSNAYLKKKRSADKKLKSNKNKLPQIYRHPME